MKLIIDIDDNLYTRLFDNGVDNYDDVAADMAKAIRKGTPLPKGYGKLIDADDLCDVISHNADLSCVYTCYSSIYRLVKEAHPIIEADKEESEDKEC